jgi:hypothetical protein
MDWIHLAQDEDERLSLMNKVETSGFHKILGIY